MGRGLGYLKDMKNKPLAPLLASFHACAESLNWVGDRDLAAAWAECERTDWMLWLAGHARVDRKLLVQVAVACARTALPHTKDPRVAECLEVVTRWTEGAATIEEVKVARKGALAAADAADAATYAAAAATYAADAAADAATYAADAAADAADAADAAADAADAAADARRRALVAEELKTQADIVRMLINVDVLAAALDAR